MTGLSSPGLYGKLWSSVAAWHMRPRTPRFSLALFCSKLFLKLSNCTSVREPATTARLCRGAAARFVHRTAPGPRAVPGRWVSAATC